MNCPIEDVKSVTTIDHKSECKALRLSPSEKAMLKSVSKRLKISESEAIRRMIKATHTALMSDCA